MKLEVTRDVVNDLWPLCRSGDASPDSRNLVEAFLAEDAGFASRLQESERVAHVVPAVRLSPDAERRLLDDARERAQAKLVLIGAVVALVGFLMLAALGGAMYFVAFNR